MATSPDPRFVYAAATCCTDDADGTPVALRRGEVYAADDRFCLARPDLFVSDVTECGPDFPRRTVAAADVVDVPPEEPKTRRGRRR
jgi:hypothetical protein